MGYEVTGFARSLTIRVYKMAYSSVVSGYPKTYDGKTNIDFLAYYSPLYSSISDDEMAKMSLVDFNARLNDFKAWLETVEYELDFDTASIIEDARIASDDCTTTTTSTSTSSSTTTTTTTIESYDFCVEYGALYNWYAATDARNIANVGFDIPSYEDGLTLYNYCGGTNDEFFNKLANLGFVTLEGIKQLFIDSGQEVPPDEVILSMIEPINANITNEYNFSFKSSGFRFFGTNLGSTDMGLQSGFWLKEIIQGDFYARHAYFMPPGMGAGSSVGWTGDHRIGMSIRLVRPATEAELLLADGTFCTPYIGNDGKIYQTVKIGTQVWLAENLAETKYRNGDLISNHGETYADKYTNEEWAALTTEAMCYYDNDISYAGEVGECPTTTTTTGEPTTTTTSTTSEPTTTTTSTLEETTTTTTTYCVFVHHIVVVGSSDIQDACDAAPPPSFYIYSYTGILEEGIILYNTEFECDLFNPRVIAESNVGIIDWKDEGIIYAFKTDSNGYITELVACDSFTTTTTTTTTSP